MMKNFFGCCRDFLLRAVRSGGQAGRPAEAGKIILLSIILSKLFGCGYAALGVPW